MDSDGFIVAGTKKRKQNKDNKDTFRKHIERTNVKNINDNKTKNRDDNIKQILCQNIINNGYCSYGDMCMYAHSLEEQNKYPKRNIVYDMLDMIINNKNVDDYIKQINDSQELQNVLLDFTRVCFKCKNGKCLGGYNCKNGVVDDKYVICYNDLMNEKCDTKRCHKIHLTKNGYNRTVHNQKIDEIQKDLSIEKTQDVQSDSDDDIINDYMHTPECCDVNKIILTLICS